MAEMQFLQEQKLPCRLPAAFHGDRGFAPLQQIPNPHRADGGLGCGLEESASLTSAFVACSWCMVRCCTKPHTQVRNSPVCPAAMTRYANASLGCVREIGRASCRERV